MLLLVGAQRADDRKPPGARPAASLVSADPAMLVPTPVVPTPVVPTPVVPANVTVPALGIAAPVVPVAAVDGVLTPPSEPDLLGWWKDGALTGDARGSALVTGHTVHTGGGALDDLEHLAPGDTVLVDGEGTRVHYRVVSVRVLSKEQLAAAATELFDQEGRPRLVLVTCEDWNGAGYDSNVVVTAVPDRPSY